MFLAWLTAFVNKIIVDHQCGFDINRSAIDQIVCINRY